MIVFVRRSRRRRPRNGLARVGWFLFTAGGLVLGGLVVRVAHVSPFACAFALLAVMLAVRSFASRRK